MWLYNLKVKWANGFM